MDRVSENGFSTKHVSQHCNSLEMRLREAMKKPIPASCTLVGWKHTHAESTTTTATLYSAEPNGTHLKENEKKKNNNNTRILYYTENNSTASNASSIVGCVDVSCIKSSYTASQTNWNLSLSWNACNAMHIELLASKNNGRKEQQWIVEGSMCCLC